MPMTVDFRAGLVDLGGTVIGGITNLSLPTNSEIEKEIVAGNASPQSATLNAVKPIASFTTQEISAALAGLGSAGRCISNMQIYAQLNTCDGVNLTNAIRYTILEGALVPTTLTIPRKSSMACT